MRKTKNILITLLLCIFALCTITSVFLFNNSIVKAQIFETEELDVSTKGVSDGTYSRAMVLSGTKSGQSAKISSKVNGNFEINFDLPKSSGKTVLYEVRFDLTDASGESFSMGYQTDTAFSGFYVAYNGEKAGISYPSKGLLHTSLDNAAGNYTAISGNNLFLRFDNSTLRVYGSAAGQEKLVWDFSSRYNDGRDLNVILDSFLNYEVKLTFVKVEYNSNPNMYIYSINGQSFTDGVLSDNVGPMVFASVDTVPVKDEKYLIPQPYVYDVIDGETENAVNVKIIDSLENIKFNQNYSENISYTFLESGNYKLIYTAKDDSNNQGSITYDLTVFNQEDAINTFDYSFPLENLEDSYGAGAVITLPSATVTSSLSLKNKDFKTRISIYKDQNNVALSEYDSILLEDSINVKFSDSGIYKVVYSADSETLNATETFFIKIVDDAAYLSAVNLANEYLFGTELEVPDADIIIGENSFEAQKRIVYPSGISYSNNVILLNEPGEYIVQYSVVTPNGNYQFNKKFNVVISGGDLFEDKNNKSEFYESSLYYYEQESGVMLSMRSGAEVRYKNIINISGSTLSDFFITYYIVPTTIGTADFGALRIRLTDVYDENNFIEILSKDSGATNTGGVGSYVQAAPYGQTLGEGYEDDWDNGQTIASGYTTLTGFRGLCFHTHGYSDLKGGFAIEDATKYLYPRTSYRFSIASTVPNFRYITDLDNPNFYEKPWEGFTTGECYVTIIPEQVGSRANVLITSIGGTSLATTTSKNTYAPIISLTEYDSNLPDGIVGVAYPLPNVYGFSKYYGVLDVESHVYLNVKGYLNEINLIDGKFIPEQTGKYTIVFTANNPDGFVTEEKYNLTIKDNLPNLTIALNEEEKVTFGYVGDEINIAGYNVENASGNAKVKITVVSPSGQESVVNNSFVPNVNGSWLVKFEVTDYILRTDSDSYAIEVSVYDTPVIKNEVSLPEGFINGFTYILPQAAALDYTANVLNPAIINGDIYVSDDSGEQRLSDNGKYIANVSHGSEVTVKYVFTASNGKTSEKIYKKTGLVVKNGNSVDMTKYFVTKGVTIAPSTEYTSFTFNTNASIAFSKEVLASGAKITFNVDGSENNFETIRIIMVDSVDAAERIEFTVSKKGNEFKDSYFCLNNGWRKNTVGSFFGNTPDVFSYTFNGMSNTISDGSGLSIAKVDKTIYGEKFNGFSSGKIYIKILLENVNGNSKLILYNISGQSINSRTSDVVAPIMQIKKSISGTYSLGSTVTISDVFAVDVLSEIKSATVSVTLGSVPGSGAVVLSERSAYNTYSLNLSEYGTYWVNYTIVDTANKKYTDSERLYVRGTTLPRLEVSGAISSSASLNSTLSVPGAVVHDGSGDNRYSVVAIDPNGQMSVISGSIKFNIKGKWIIRYFAYDKYYNCSTIDYVVNVA